MFLKADGSDDIIIDYKIKRAINKIPIAYRINFCLEIARQNIEELNRQGVLSKEKVTENLTEWIKTIKLFNFFPI